MKEKIAPLPEPIMPHPMHFPSCIDGGHDPYPNLILTLRAFSELRFLYCRRCGLSYVEHRKTTEARSEGEKGE
jgi:hypothetical protein